MAGRRGAATRASSGRGVTRIGRRRRYAAAGPDNTEGEEPPEGAIALPVIEQDGQRFIPVFTSEDSLRAAGGDASTAVRIPIAQLAANWPNEDVWLAVNPASEDGLGIPSDVVRALPVFAMQTSGNGHSGGDATAGGDSAGSEPEASPA